MEQAARGDLRGAEQWRRLAAADPFNSRVACLLAQAQQRAGDRRRRAAAPAGARPTLRQELGIPRLPSDDARPRVGRPGAPARRAHQRACRECAAPSPRVGIATGRRGATAATPRPLALGAAAAVVLAVLVVRRLGPLAGTDGGGYRDVTAIGGRAAVCGSPAPGATRKLFQRRHRRRAEHAPRPRAGAEGGGADLRVCVQGQRPGDAQAIGRALNVDALVEGSVRQAEGRSASPCGSSTRAPAIRSGPTPGSAADRTCCAAGRDRHERAARLRPSRPPAPRRRRPGAFDPAGLRSPSAGPLFLAPAHARRPRRAPRRPSSGRWRWRPAYAQAHSGVADAYAVLGFYDHLPPRDAFPRAKAAATRALALDAGLAEAHASLGYVALYYDWDWAAAERALDRAVALNPNYSVAHQWRANFLVARGRFDDAVTAMRRAQEIDPLSLIASAALGWVHLPPARRGAAVQQCRRTIDLNPSFEQAWLWGGMAHGRRAARATAWRCCSAPRRCRSAAPPVLAALGRALAVSGDVAGARAHPGGARARPCRLPARVREWRSCISGWATPDR